MDHRSLGTSFHENISMIDGDIGKLVYKTHTVIFVMSMA